MLILAHLRRHEALRAQNGLRNTPRIIEQGNYKAVLPLLSAQRAESPFKRPILDTL